MTALEISGLYKSFGALPVIQDLDLAVEPGERHAVIGPNGAGKTTLFNLITGWLRPDAGTIRVCGTDVTRLSPQRIVALGLSRSFQRNMVFEQLSVFENLRLAVQAMDRSRYRLLRDRLSFGDVCARAEAAAQRMGLDGVIDQTASALSYGEKRQLEVALALCSEPRVLLLDEPAAGTSPSERARLIELIVRLPREVTSILVEHDMDVVFGVCDRITVLSYGRMLATGSPAEVRANEDVLNAYLGRSHA